MAEALECEKLKNAKPKKPAYKSRYDGRLKKRQWDNDNRNDNDVISEKRANFDPASRIKKKKSVILMGYSGVNYFGMQRNPGQRTIEEDLFEAMLKNNWIDKDGFDQAQYIQFQRAARTDKGVSAARQICSIKLPEALNIDELNSDLCEQIRVFAVKRVTKGFNAKDQCNARTYSYTLPTIALARHDETCDLEKFRISSVIIDRFNEILKTYHGTKNFHNFTSRREFLDPSVKRFIMLFECSQPFLSPENVEFATVRVKGQSFMMHQIRKMIGLALAVVRGHTVIETINRAFKADKLDIPMAPGLGLVLDQVHYERYNDRYGSDGIHEPLIWDKEEDKINTFVAKYINSTIYKTELQDKSMLTWLETLGYHSYDVRIEKTNTEDFKPELELSVDQK